MSLREVCVCYLIKETADGSMVLLGRKKTGLGIGKLVGPGGKLETAESPIQAVVREVQEEVGICVDPSSLRLIGEIDYRFPHRPEWSQKSWAFVATSWEGDAVESVELQPAWYFLSELPAGEMWDDAKHWASAALFGGPVRATFVFGVDGHTVTEARVELR